MRTHLPRGALLSIFALLACSSSEPSSSDKAAADKAANDKAVNASAQPASAADAPPLAPPPKPVSIRGVARPLSTDVAGLVQMDRLDIASDPDEAAHNYAITSQTFRGMHDFDWAGGKVSYMEDGRSTKGTESFQLACLPNQDHVLVKAVDTLSKDQRVRVIIEGKNVGEWSVPNGGTSRYAEVSFPISGSMIGDRTSLNIRLEYVSGNPDTSSLMYWLFTKPNRKLVTPINTTVAGYALIDKVDVGTDADEAAHKYVMDKAHYFGVHEFQAPAGSAPFLENGRATRSFESFQVKVKPGVDHLLIKAFDTFSRDQKVTVSVDGTPLGDWAFPNAALRYNEASIVIPAKVIGDRQEVTVRVDFVSGSIDTNSFYYWVYAKSGEAANRVALETKG